MTIFFVLIVFPSTTRLYVYVPDGNVPDEKLTVPEPETL
jgi:hypothetical protein